MSRSAGRCIPPPPWKVQLFVFFLQIIDVNIILFNDLTLIILSNIGTSWVCLLIFQHLKPFIKAWFILVIIKWINKNILLINIIGTIIWFHFFHCFFSSENVLIFIFQNIRVLIEYIQLIQYILKLYSFPLFGSLGFFAEFFIIFLGKSDRFPVDCGA